MVFTIYYTSKQKVIVSKWKQVISYSDAPETVSVTRALDFQSLCSSGLPDYPDDKCYILGFTQIKLFSYITGIKFHMHTGIYHGKHLAAVLYS